MTGEAMSLDPEEPMCEGYKPPVKEVPLDMSTQQDNQPDCKSRLKKKGRRKLRKDSSIMSVLIQCAERQR